MAKNKTQRQLKNDPKQKGVDAADPPTNRNQPAYHKPEANCLISLKEKRDQLILFL